MLVQSTNNDDDEFNTSMSAPSANHSSSTAPLNLPTTTNIASISFSHLAYSASNASPSSPRVSFQLPTAVPSSPTAADCDVAVPIGGLSSSAMKARRRTWNIAEVQIGDRLLSPFRERTRPTKDRRMSVRQSVGLAMMEEEEEEVGEAGYGGGREVGGLEKTAFEAANVQHTLRFSALTEEDSELGPPTTLPTPVASSAAPSGATDSTPPASPGWATGTASEKSPPFVGFINTTRRGGRPAVRQSIRLSSRRQTIASSSSSASPATIRRQTIAPISSSTSTSASVNSSAASGGTWPAVAGPRPLRPTSTFTSNNPAAARPATAVTKQKPRFDVAASLARPVTWKMHKGPLTERVNGSGVKAEGKVAIEREKGGKDDVRVRQRRDMRQKSIDYARNVRLGQRAGQENHAPTATQQ